ncbi:phosphate regulon sensor histidine kinase PhoR [Wenzhouxiangella sp. AB-CW3]|uniref:phosphate regulon sensor histidine kinase PhoR n=1 Tax=Wenzhouxiangella sp. AB-CW3 TaxID=2771012 RepID=UPI00168AB83D|nr:phosphate regulon sensor histidine kinase PhoR [Wenzhouxiangella sp. AB-CW3]QOC21552.1 phosphate regulon sensor histidine kinase PhoR [Wenzhouxiangella sp. AB-CW3]
MSRNWIGEIMLLGALLFGSVLFGVFFGQVAWFLVFALALFLARWVWQMYRLDEWLDSRRRQPPEAWGIWGHVFDEYHQLQRRQYKSKKRLARVIREFRESTTAMPDGTLVLDDSFHISWCNEAATRLVGLVPRRDLGQAVTNLIRSPVFAKFLSTGDFNQALEIRSPIDDARTLMLRLVPYGNHQYLLIIRDITRLVRLQAMRRDFVANASHELRSPLTVLAGYLDMLASGNELGPEWQKPVSEMQAQCRRMTNLLNDLLELSRLETDETDASDEYVVDVDGLIRRIFHDVRAMDEDKHVLDVDIDPDCQLRAIEGELHSAMSNLLTNALRYSPEGTTITVRWFKSDSGMAIFEVTDQGVGIEKKHIPFITQRFYRVDSSHSRKTGGTGLGLAIVKHVLKRHGAQLEVESEPGEGSTFRFVFPADRVVRRSGLPD